MNILNIKVKHKFFGIGIITEFDGNSIAVQFENKKSIFIYPDAFEKFLTDIDPSIQEEIMKKILKAKKSSEEKRKAKFETYLANIQKKKGFCKVIANHSKEKYN